MIHLESLSSCGVKRLIQKERKYKCTEGSLARLHYPTTVVKLKDVDEEHQFSCNAVEL